MSRGAGRRSSKRRPRARIVSPRGKVVRPRETKASRVQPQTLIAAFLNGNKHKVNTLLSRRRRRPPQPADIRRIRTPEKAASLLHLAASRCGWKGIAVRLVDVYKCDPYCKDSEGDTPLHYAADKGHLEVAKYLVKDRRCDPMDKNNGKSTPLHLACKNGHFEIVQFLLSTEGIDPLAEDVRGYTPLFYATGKYDIVEQFQHITGTRNYRIHTSTKLILTGDSDAGKTTVAKIVGTLLAGGSQALPVTPTAGIVAHDIESKLGKFVVYDMAGYHSSHAAVLERVMRNSAAVFLCVIDLSKSNDIIRQSLHYWLTFINNACNTAAGGVKSHVLIIGIHADQVKSRKEMEEKSSLLQNVSTLRLKAQMYCGYITMNCHSTNAMSNSSSQLMLSSILTIQEATQPSIGYYCHLLYAFLQTMVTNKMTCCCTLSDLASFESSLNDPSVILKDLLTTLDDKGLILFTQSNVIVKMVTLLNDIIGTLFAPRHFNEHHLASDDGTIRTSDLQKVFPQYKRRMLVHFLTSLDFCLPVNPLSDKLPRPSRSVPDFLFFPDLVQLERPSDLTQHGALKFGWCLGCMDQHEFFSSRFLHVLILLSLACEHPQVSQGLSCSSAGEIQHVYTVWKNGIFWRNYDNITTVIELLNNNRWILVIMSSGDAKSIQHAAAKLRSSLISLVRSLQQKHCPCLDISEFVISPQFVSKYPFDSLPDSELFLICHVAQAILHQKSVVPSYKDGRGYLPVQSLPLEPYHLLPHTIVCQLWDPKMADRSVPSQLLQKIRQFREQSKMKSQVYKELREELNGLSIFAGRNPLVSGHIYTVVMLRCCVTFSGICI